MRALLLGKAELEAIASLRRRAHAAPLSAEFLKLAAQGFKPDDPATRPDYEKTSVEGRIVNKAGENVALIPLDYTIDIPHGFRVTYTEEMQPIGRCRHLSVSVDTPGRAPNQWAIQSLMTEFGFERPLGDRQSVYPEVYSSGLTAINVIEPMEMADAG